MENIRFSITRKIEMFIHLLHIASGFLFFMFFYYFFFFIETLEEPTMLVSMLIKSRHFNLKL